MYAVSGTMALLLLCLCLCWKWRQYKLGVDDFGELLRVKGQDVTVDSEGEDVEGSRANESTGLLSG